EPAARRVTFVNAGLPDPYLVRRGGAMQSVEATGPRLPLGLRRDVGYQATEIALAVGDALVLLSDGLPEATMPDGEQLGYEKLADIIRAAGPDADAIIERVQAVSGEGRDDDQTIVVLGVTS